MQLSRKISGLSPSQTLVITKKAQDLKKSGKDTVILCAGEPDFPTPLPVAEAGIKAIRDGKTKYTANPGIIELREAIAEKLLTENGLKYSPDEIIVTNGAKQAIYNGFRCLLNSGDEVLVPSPCWVSYVEQIKLAHGIPTLVFGASVKPQAEEMARKITSKTTALIINSPNNPVGYIYNKQELIEIARLCQERDLILLSDEIYEKIIFDDNKHFSPPALVPEIRNRTLLINGFSKAFSMTGWRIGYAAGPKDMITLLNRIQSHQTSNACTISQYAALEGLKNPEVQLEVRKMVKTFSERRDYFTSELDKIPHLSYYKPEGAFYVFVKVDHYYNQEIRNSNELCNWLLDEFMLAVVPGESFFSEEYIRISFAASWEELEKGLVRLKKALGRLSQK
ncbi:MAG: pyridoxal phosphate-dependent aminotransferase [Candidatus Wallbacteria bacterium]|nr:pyridoxal phosphate-dependent aminotransferase [Candidatus Wallbacteria bacterium]